MNLSFFKSTKNDKNDKNEERVNVRSDKKAIPESSLRMTIPDVVPTSHNQPASSDNIKVEEESTFNRKKDTNISEDQYTDNLSSVIDNVAMTAGRWFGKGISIGQRISDKFNDGLKKG